jgi:hypothetical protein
MLSGVGLSLHARRRVALGAAAILLLVIVLAARACGDDEDSGPSTTEAAAEERRRPELPRGGRRLFPDYRVVALYGNPRAAELGELGIGTPTRAAIKLERQARPYARGTRPVLPAMELISTIATAAPGPRGDYREPMPAAMIDRYHRAARRAKALLILDIQPGRAKFGPDVARLERWLREPDVGLALDPEWHVGPGQRPGQVIGSTDALSVNAIAKYLSKLVREHDLPEKLLLVHRFTESMIVNDGAIREFPGVQVVINIDGFGGREIKSAKYRELAARTPQVGHGFKLFYKEDVGLMKPRSVMALQPRPEVVVYE